MAMACPVVSVSACHQFFWREDDWHLVVASLLKDHMEVEALVCGVAFPCT